MIKTIIFDVGGVITFTNFEALYANFANRAGISPQFVRDYHKLNMRSLLLGEITLQETWSEMVKRGAEPNTDFEKNWIQEGLKQRLINEDLLEFIRKLRKKYTVGVLSDANPSRLLLDNQIDLFKNFTFVRKMNR